MKYLIAILFVVGLAGCSKKPASLDLTAGLVPAPGVCDVLSHESLIAYEDYRLRCGLEDATPENPLSGSDYMTIEYTNTGKTELMPSVGSTILSCEFAVANPNISSSRSGECYVRVGNDFKLYELSTSGFGTVAVPYKVTSDIAR